MAFANCDCIGLVIDSHILGVVKATAGPSYDSAFICIFIRLPWWPVYIVISDSLLANIVFVFWVNFFGVLFWQNGEDCPFDLHTVGMNCNIVGSPFRACIKDELNPSEVRCFGPDLDHKQVRLGQVVKFTVDASDAGEAPLDVKVTDQNGRFTK